MLSSIFTAYSTSTTDSFTPTQLIISLGSAFAIGIFLAFIYQRTSRDRSNNQGFALTLAVLPAILAIIIMLIGSNVARAFSLAGAFSIIRFRSAPGDPRDIAQVLFALAVGLACGMGYITYAVLFAIIVSLVMLILSAAHFGQRTSVRKQLIKILVPEDISYSESLEPIIRQYVQNYELIRIKTVELGSLYEITYRVVLADAADPRGMIDKLRCHNSNLAISLSVDSSGEAALY